MKDILRVGSSDVLVIWPGYLDVVQKMEKFMILGLFKGKYGHCWELVEILI